MTNEWTRFVVYLFSSKSTIYIYKNIWKLWKYDDIIHKILEQFSIENWTRGYSEDFITMNFFFFLQIL